jgi:DNA repair protein RecN (Recombination protein N)
VRTLGRLAKRLGEAPDARLQSAARACQAALEQVRDAAAFSGDVAETLAPDPAELARVGERIDGYQGLFRKHGDGDGALVAVGERLRSRLEELASLGERLAAAQRERDSARAERAALGERLAKARARAAKQLAVQVHAHLAELGMPKAVLSLSQEELAEPGPLGSVRQELLVATNPGMPAGRLGEIASGGETSRIALALAEAMASRDPIPVLVFDEVDSGVGGRLGAVIGAKLARLARDRTVLAVTHTPQLAAAAHRQYMVSKSHSAQRTTVTVTEVSGEDRLREISEMLGGGRAALDQARALMQGSVR